MPPLRHAVSLVDGKKTDACPLKHCLRIAERQSFGRDIEKTQAAICNAVENGGRFLAAVRRIEGSGRNSMGLQLRDLVAHERNERRDHDGQSIS